MEAPASSRPPPPGVRRSADGKEQPPHGRAPRGRRDRRTPRGSHARPAAALSASLRGLTRPRRLQLRDRPRRTTDTAAARGAQLRRGDRAAGSGTEPAGPHGAARGEARRTAPTPRSGRRPSPPGPRTPPARSLREPIPRPRPFKVRAPPPPRPAHGAAPRSLPAAGPEAGSPPAAGPARRSRRPPACSRRRLPRLPGRSRLASRSAPPSPGAAAASHPARAAGPRVRTHGPREPPPGSPGPWRPPARGPGGVGGDGGPRPQPAPAPGPPGPARPGLPATPAPARRAAAPCGGETEGERRRDLGPAPGCGLRLGPRPRPRGLRAGRGARERGLTFRHVLVDGALDLREAPLQVVAARGAAAAAGSCGHTGRVRPRGPARPRPPPRPGRSSPRGPSPAMAGRPAGAEAAADEAGGPAQLLPRHLSQAATAAAAAAAAEEGFFSPFQNGAQCPSPCSVTSPRRLRSRGRGRQELPGAGGGALGRRGCQGRPDLDDCACANTHVRRWEPGRGRSRARAANPRPRGSSKTARGAVARRRPL